MKKDEDTKDSGEFEDISEIEMVAEWRPSMNLFDLIKSIPNFIQKLVDEHGKKGKDQGGPHTEMIGKFYLGLNYDY